MTIKENRPRPNSNTEAHGSSDQRVMVRSGFTWDAADAYLFDIDGTLLNSRDAVHYFSFRNALRTCWRSMRPLTAFPYMATQIWELSGRCCGKQEWKTGNRSTLPRIFKQMVAEVSRNRDAFVLNYVLPFQNWLSDCINPANCWAWRPAIWSPLAGSNWRRQDCVPGFNLEHSLFRSNFARISFALAWSRPQTSGRRRDGLCGG